MVAVLLVIMANWSLAQVHSFKNFGLDKNAFPSRIECLEQGASGKLFIGTLAGLVIYDGYEFQQLSERQGMAENAISSIGRSGDFLWMGHWAGSITIYNDSNGSMQRHDLRQALNYSPINSILPFGNASAFLVTEEGKLYYFSEQEVEQLVVPGAALKNSAQAIIPATDGFLLVTEDGLFQVTVNEAGYEWVTLYESNVGISAASRLFGAEWAIAEGLELFLLNTSTGEKQLIPAPVQWSRVVDVIQDQEEFIWFGSEEHGVFQYHPITGESHHIGRDNGLSYNQVRSLFCDREGLVWVATSAGLDQYLGRSFLLYDRRFGMPDNLIWDFHINGTELLLATASGLYKADFSADYKDVQIGAQINLNNQEPRRIFVARGGQHRYVIDDRGVLWTAEANSGFREVTSIQGTVQCIEEVNGVIWVGTDQGIAVLDGDQVSEVYTQHAGLGGDNINGIYYSKVRNECWITVLGGACTLYKGGRFQKFGPNEGLTSNVIQDAAFDAEGNPWFASYDDGVLYFKEGKFHNLEDRVVLSSNTTFAIEIDAEQNVWIGHNWGIDRYRIPYEDLVSFGNNEGFMGVEVNPGAIQIDDKNRIWMGTLMGVLRFVPIHYRKNLWEPIAYFNEVTLGGKPISSGQVMSELDLANSDLRVKFNGVSLANPERNSYQYRLVDLEQEWRTKALPGAIEYSSIPYGSYTLELKACNNSGKCNAQPVTFEFSIKPPFYKSWWFYSLLFLIVVIFIYLMDKFRFTSVLDEKNQLAEKLAAQDQQLIELDQEVTELMAFRRYNADLVNQISAPPELPNVQVKKIESNALLSDHVIAWNCGTCFIKGLLDTGVNGLGSALVVEALKARFFELLINEPTAGVERIFELLESAAEAIGKGVEKHRGFEWVMWIQKDTKLHAALKGNSLYLINDGQVLEQKSAREGQGIALLELSADDRFFAASDGLVEQLGQDGTRLYSKKRLMNKLLEVANQPADDILNHMSKDLLNWRDAMEQEDDITMIIHER